MECKHPRIKSVNCVIFCCECGAILPAEWNKPPDPKAAEMPKAAKRKKKEDQAHGSDSD